MDDSSIWGFGFLPKVSILLILQRKVRETSNVALQEVCVDKLLVVANVELRWLKHCYR
jgi:hypothetical protein